MQYNKTMTQPATAPGPQGHTKHLTWHTDGSITTVTLNRPDQLNAITLDTYGHFITLCEAIATNPAVRVVVLRGSGSRAFAAGTDINEFHNALRADPAKRHENVLHVEQRSADALAAFAQIPQLTVAAVNGVAAGAGFGLALAADLRVGVSGARVGFPIARTLGNVLSEDMTTALVSVVGHSWARRILLAAEMVPVDELVACGAWSWVCSAEEFDDRLAAWTGRLAQLSPLTQAGSKTVLNGLDDPSTTARDQAAKLVDRAYRSSDFAGAVAAFAAKKPAEFTSAWPL